MDFVKFNGAFICELLEDEICRAMIKSLAEVSAVIQMQFISELVESVAVRQ